MKVDGVFCSDHMTELFIQCQTAPDQQGLNTDHITILLTIELEIPQPDATPNPNYWDIEWKDFIQQIPH